MTLTPLPYLFARALQGGYAIGYFESWNFESLQGVIDAAEMSRSPIIIGFNGEYLTRAGRLANEKIAWYAALGRAAAETASVPCGLIFNECPEEAPVRQAVLAGFNLVMLSNGEWSYDEYTRRVADLVQFAHLRGAAVEAEIDELPVGSTGEVITKHSQTTDPELAARFVASTGVDLLSVSVGNVHVLLGNQRELDLDLLARIHATVNVPLGLHGGTGIADVSLRRAIQLGVTKVAYGTNLKQRYLEALRRALGRSEINPHELLGMGGERDVMIAGRLAVRDAVLDRLEILGCCGKA